MPVRAFITRDPAGNPWPPVHEHEATAAIGLIQRLYESLNHERGYYVVMANLHVPSADLVVLTELGVGVLELKHTEGRLAVIDGEWFGSGRLIKAGRGARNPHDQAQSYAVQIRRGLSAQLEPFWSLAKADIEQGSRIQYAVCFTNPAMVVAPELKEQLEREANGSSRRPGNFTLLAPASFPSWVASLRFGLEQGHTASFAPYRLNAQQIATILASYFKGSEWTEIKNLMPTGQPYAYLTLRQPDQPPQLFPLRTSDTTIGRDGTLCTLLLPESFKRASRQHARVSRSATSVALIDLDSTHGTFVDGVQISQPVRLKPGQIVTLGGPSADQRVCALTFSLDLPAEFRAGATAADQ